MKTKKFSFDVNEILNSQQNKFPLMFIDRIVSLKPGKELKAIKNFTYNEWFFPAHFEGEPNVPGFIQVECMAQAFIMTFLSKKEFRNQKTNFYNISEAKFRRKIVPGDVLTIYAKLKSFSRGIAQGSAEGFVGKEFTCSGNFIVTIPQVFEKFVPKKIK